LLLCAVATLGLMVASMFVVPWFRAKIEGLELGGFDAYEIDLRSVRSCGPGGVCGSVPLSNLKGFYPTLSVITFWASCVLAAILVYQAGLRLFQGFANEAVTRFGYLLAVICFLLAFAAAFLFAPETQSAMDISVTVTRTWGPAMLLGADFLALFVLRMSVADVSDTSFVADPPRVAPRAGTSPPLARAGTAPPMPRAGTSPPGSAPIPRPTSTPMPRAASSIPLDARPASTSIEQPVRPSSIPLGDAPPASEPAPPRTKAPSEVPFLTAADLPILDPGPFGFPSSATAAPRPAPPIEDPVATPTRRDRPALTLSFATERASLSETGITATRETGDVKQVAWVDVVGVVARRLPADEPYDGQTFVDVVSNAGSTLRILPWTHLDGELLPSDTMAATGEERARALVQLVATRCADAKLDGATRTFLGGRGHAAQLPNADTLALHDARLA
jgi:hypothetical protein